MGMIHERPMKRSESEAWDLLNKVNYNQLTMDELDIMAKVIREAQARIRRPECHLHSDNRRSEI